MRCGVLGPLEVRGENGALLDVPGAKERLLLALLTASSPHVVTVEQLTEQLWDGSPPPSSHKSLQSAVVRLRTALEPGRPRGSPGRYVVRRQRGYALVLDREELDATAFADRVSRGRALLASGDPAAADRLLREALELWRGEPYADWPDVLALENERVRLDGLHDLATEVYWDAQLALGRHDEAVPELRRLTLERPLQERWWELLVLALYRSGHQGEALDALRRARAVLAEELGVDPGVRLRELERAVLAQDAALDLATTPVTASAPVVDQPLVSGCPWKGLARYEPADAAVFHGRERLVSTMVAALVDHPVVVLSGSSGAGKSSVARAGLLPALAAGAIPGSAAWQPLVLTPGARPVDALAPLSGDPAPEAPVVLVCDQLEQLWSPEVPDVERAAFLDTVLGLVADQVVARALLVVRGDHVGRLAEHPELAERMLGGLVMVPPMSELELRQVVEAPAAAAGLRLEPELVEVVVGDVLGRSGALPLLSTALVQTWERRRDHALTLAGYLASGGVAGAIGRSAEMVHDGWDEEERRHARRILVRLAEQDEDGTVRARRLPLAELGAIAADAADRVVDTLVAARLVAREDDHLEVAHEALLTGWPRLAGWLEEDAAGRAVRRHLAPAALEWDAHGRPADELYRGARLEAAAQWTAAPDSTPTPIEREFVAAGLAQADAELTAARERAEAEAAGHRRTRRFAGGLAVVLVLAVVATLVAVVFQRRADEQATVADANRLAALSSSARSLDLSLLLAAAAVRTADTPATRDSLLDTLVEHRRAEGVFQLSEEGVEETALSADGRTMAITIGGGSPHVLAWRPGSAEPPRTLLERWPDHLAVSPDGRTIVGVGGNTAGAFAAYSASGQRLPATTGKAALGGYPRDIAYTPNGRLLMVTEEWAGPRVGHTSSLARVDLAAGEVTRLAPIGTTHSSDRGVTFLAAFTDDASAVVAWALDQSRAYWMAGPGWRPVRLRLEARTATSLEFVATPSGALQFWSDGAVTRYDARGRPVQGLDVHRGPVLDASVLPGGRTGVTVGDGGQVELWTVEPRSGAWSLRESLVGHAGAVQQVEPSSDGRALLTSSRDGQVILWDLSLDAGFGETYRGLGDRWVSNRVHVVEPGRLVVAPARTRSASAPSTVPGAALDHGPGSESVAAAFWDPRDGRVVDEVVVGDTFSGTIFGSSAAVSPDRRLVAITSGLATTVLDTRTRERVARIPMPQGGILEFAVSASWTPDGSRLLVGAEGITSGKAGIMVVDASTWDVTRPFVSDTSVQVMEWSDDGEILVTGVNYHGRIDVYDAALRRLRSVDLGEGGDVWDLAFSPDGTMLAAARDGGGVTVLDTRSWRPVNETATMHPDSTLDVEWLPDGNTVVSTGVDEVISMYDVARDLVRARPLPVSEVQNRGSTFLLPPSSDEVVALNEDGPGRRYPLDPAEWLAEACTVAGRNLTQAEWDRYLPDRPYEPVCDLTE